jgi:hypothetical protein
MTAHFNIYSFKRESDGSYSDGGRGFYFATSAGILEHSTGARNREGMG